MSNLHHWFCSTFSSVQLHYTAECPSLHGHFSKCVWRRHHMLWKKQQILMRNKIMAILYASLLIHKYAGCEQSSLPDQHGSRGNGFFLLPNCTPADGTLITINIATRRVLGFVHVESTQSFSAGAPPCTLLGKLTVLLQTALHLLRLTVYNPKYFSSLPLHKFWAIMVVSGIFLVMTFYKYVHMHHCQEISKQHKRK